MKLYSDFSSLNSLNKQTVVSIGMFDSVHLGHRSVLEKVLTLSKNNNLESVLITFSNAPSIFFQKSTSNDFIFPIEDKINQFKSLGIDHVFILPFDEYIASLDAKVFVEDILVKYLNIKYLVLGYDNHFGKGRVGSVDFINLHYAPRVGAYSVAAVLLNSQIISSSLIKQFLKLGDMEAASSSLGRSYYIKGIVTKGKQLGRQIGFKTANIHLNENLFVPSFGVYAVKIILEQATYLGVCNIGIRPTIVDDNKINVETHIFDFDKEIYDQEIQILFISKIREEIKFNSLDELKIQIQKDIQTAKFILN